MPKPFEILGTVRHNRMDFLIMMIEVLLILINLPKAIQEYFVISTVTENRILSLNSSLFDRNLLASNYFKMQKIKKVCVYCASSDKIDPSYKEATQELAKALGEKSGNCGLWWRGKRFTG